MSYSSHFFHKATTTFGVSAFKTLTAYQSEVIAFALTIPHRYFTFSVIVRYYCKAVENLISKILEVVSVLDKCARLLAGHLNLFLRSGDLGQGFRCQRRFWPLVAGSLLGYFFLLPLSSSAQTLVGQNLRLTTGPCQLTSGPNSPEGVVIGKICDQFFSVTTGALWQKWSGTTTNTGWVVGFPINARINGTLTLTDYLTTPNYVSQLTGYRIDALGNADLRYLYVDELHAKLFSADLEQALAGLQLITKSVSVLSSNFVCPSSGGSASLFVEDLPGAPALRVFELNDFVLIRNFSRGAGSLDISDCIGRVSNPLTPPTGIQQWTFTRVVGSDGGAMIGGTTINSKTLVLDMGISGGGYAETNAIDGAYSINSPYSQFVTWATSPSVSNRSLRVRTGNLRGITGVNNEFGFITYGPTPAFGSTQSSFKASSVALEAKNLDLSLYSGITEVIKFDHTTPSIAVGSAVPTGYSTGIGIWMGRDTDSVYKFRVGNPLANRITWNGTTLQIVGDGGGITSINGANIQTGTISADKGTFGSGLNQLRNADCKVSFDDWSYYGNSGVPIAPGWALVPWNLNNETATCFIAIQGTPGSNTVSGGFLPGTFPVVAGNRYEASTYFGVHRSGVTQVYIQWFDAASTQLASSAAGSTCTAANSGGQTLAGYCRSVIIATAPATATQARWVFQTFHTGEASPYIFWVHAYFGEATANQSEASPWGPPGLTEIIGGVIKTNSITALQIAAGTITGDRIAASTLTAGNIAAGTITGDRIAASTLTAGNIAAGTITTGQLAANSVSAAQIQAGAITAVKIAAGTITADKLNVGSLSAVSANLGTVTAGVINGVSITGGTITGGTISIGSASFLGGFNVSAAGATNINALDVGSLNIRGGGLLLIESSAGGGNRNLCVTNGGFVYASAGAC